MTVKSETMSPQIKALRKTDLSPLIRMSGMMLPRMFEGFFDCLETKQKRTFEQIMPIKGEKQIFIHLVDTPTPPITILLAHPPKISTTPEKELSEKKIKGIKLKTDQLQLISSGVSAGKVLRLLWQLKGQIFTILGISFLFTPLLSLGPAGLKDLRSKATTRFKPLFDMLLRNKK